MKEKTYSAGTGTGRSGRRRWGAVAGAASAIAACAVIVPQLGAAPSASAVGPPPADGKVTCAMAPLATSDTGLTTGEAKEFSATVVPGTAACTDLRAEHDPQVIGLSYSAAGPIAGKGNCGEFTLPELKLNLEWVLAGSAENAESTLTMTSAELKGATFTVGSATVEGGPLAGSAVTHDSTDAAPALDAASGDCATATGVTKIAAPLSLIFTPAS
jgi:hypothetical protein